MAKMLKSVKGLRVLVTGGCSGLGAATVKRMLDGGARVLVVDIADSLAAGAPTPAKGAPVLYRRADVTSEEAIQEAMATAKKEFDGLDAVVNCAAIGIAARCYNWNKDSAFSIEDFLRLLHVNTLGTFNVCRLAAQLMAKNAPVGTDSARGVIVNTASISAFDGQATQVAYSTSKAAVVGMTLPLSRDLAPIGIRVCSIAPGYFDSPLCNRQSYPPRLVKFLADHNRAIYRLGRPEEFADMVDTVLRNPMLNGVNIRLDAASRGFFFNRRKRAVPLIADDGDDAEGSTVTATATATATAKLATAASAGGGDF